MKKIIYSLILIITLVSCKSAQDLVEKAIKKDPNIILCKDSIVEKVIKGETITLFGKDSLIINTDRVLIRATSDSINGLKLEYTLKDTTITTKETTPVITPKKTRQETRQENKTEREKEDTKQVEAKQNGRTNRVEVKQDGKSDRTKTRKENKRNWFDLLLVGIAIGAAGMYLFMVKILRR